MSDNVQVPISLKNINYVLEIIENNGDRGNPVILLRKNDLALNIHLLHDLYDHSEFSSKAMILLESVYGIPVVYVMGDIIRAGHFTIVVIRP
ncbi:hypothetical protein LCGC14_2919920 [marine sediment metagenome]|uniref:Uncharacterized protein n=1 Tax=marine sediment metagenome TaxID=412755 RepID=A0A0F8ZWN1_9ZZZZ